MGFSDRYAQQRSEKDPEFKALVENSENTLNHELRKELIGLRLNLDLTQKEFAELVGVQQPVISKLENGTHNIKVERLNRILANTNTGARLKISKKDGTELLTH